MPSGMIRGSQAAYGQYCNKKHRKGNVRLMGSGATHCVMWGSMSSLSCTYQGT